MKISVLTPSYNSGLYIERTILSVLGQKYKNYEHIIVDGGSTDNTIEILNRYKHLIWISEKDCGQSDAMNKAFKMSTGDIILYLNSDDEVCERAFEMVIKSFNNNQISFLVGNLIFDFNNATDIKVPTTKLDEVVRYKEYKFPLNPSSYYYKRSVQEKIGEFPIKYHYAMDYWFLLKAYYFFDIFYINECLGKFNVSQFSKSQNLLKVAKELREIKFRFIIWRFKMKLINFFKIVKL